MFRVDLRRLIMALCLFSTLLAAVTFMLASYLVQRDQLVSTALESNRVYALKLAKLTDTLLVQSRNALMQVAQDASNPLLSPSERQTLIARLQRHTSYFNSVVWFGPDNRVMAQSPDNLGRFGQVVDTDRSRRAILMQEPTITDPFIASTGRMLLSQIVPIKSSDGHPQGYVIGNLYLHEANELHSLLDEHYFKDASYTYVLNKRGEVVFHPDAKWIGERAPHEEIIKAMAAAPDGKMFFPSGNGQVTLAGFATVATSGWGVVVARPQADVLQRLNELSLRTLLIAAPLVLLSLLLIGWHVTHIEKP